MKPIDLRSDTVTRPSAPMRQAMASAEVGDDVYGEDPTVRRLEERACELTGKARALFVPSGTMANLIAVKVHTEPGDEVIVGEGAHIYFYEGGGGAVVAGCMFNVLAGGLFGADDVKRAIRPDDAHFPRTRLVCCENTHNRAGGRIFPQQTLREIAAVCREHRPEPLRLHLDGARLLNAQVATGLAATELCAPFDTVSVCLSKGLGAPLGSLLCGSEPQIARAHRLRKLLGGGMRQAGIVAAAGLYALDHNVERLADDHRAARRFAEQLATAKWLSVDLDTVQTNIVSFGVAVESGLTAAQLTARLRAAGVLVNAIAPQRLRAVTHLDVSADEVTQAGAAIIAEVARGA